MRKLLMIVLASSTFGGVIGALATAATESQASPSAIAAAVQRVQDTQADQALESIRGKLQTTNGKLGALVTSASAITTDIHAMRTQLDDSSASTIRYITQQLQAVCENLQTANRQSGAFPFACPSPTIAPIPLHRRP